MNFRKNKGYVGIDASIAILVLLIIIPTIAGMIYNVNKSNALIDRKTEAISIAVNTIEAIKGIGIEDMQIAGFDGTNIVDNLKNIYPNLPEEKTVTGDINTKMIIEGLTLTKDENTYKIYIEIEDYANTITDEGITVQTGKVKKIKVKVTFKSGKKEKDIELNTVIS